MKANRRVLCSSCYTRVAEIVRVDDDHSVWQEKPRRIPAGRAVTAALKEVTPMHDLNATYEIPPRPLAVPYLVTMDGERRPFHDHTEVTALCPRHGWLKGMTVVEVLARDNAPGKAPIYLDPLAGSGA